MIREVVTAAVLALMIATPAMFAARAQSAQAGRSGPPDLIGMLKGTPACFAVAEASSASEPGRANRFRHD